MPRRYWLMKCEPAAYTIGDLARDGRASWEGVRNYQARNFMRDQMQEGDPVLFYASNAAPSGVTGLATIAKAGYPDHFAWKKGHKYFAAASNQASPIWYMVDIAFVERFADTVSLDTLKSTKGLEEMMVTRRGSRLSVQPVTKAEYDIVVRLTEAHYLSWLEGREQLLKLLLVRRDGVGRAGELDEHVPATALHDGAQQPIAGNGALGRGDGTAQSRVVTGRVNGGDGQPANRARGDLCSRRLSVWAAEWLFHRSRLASTVPPCPAPKKYTPHSARALSPAAGSTV